MRQVTSGCCNFCAIAVATWSLVYVNFCPKDCLELYIEFRGHSGFLYEPLRWVLIGFVTLLAGYGAGIYLLYGWSIFLVAFGIGTLAFACTATIGINLTLQFMHFVDAFRQERRGLHLRPAGWASDGGVESDREVEPDREGPGAAAGAVTVTAAASGHSQPAAEHGRGLGGDPALSRRKLTAVLDHDVETPETVAAIAIRPAAAADYDDGARAGVPISVTVGVGPGAESIAARQLPARRPPQAWTPSVAPRLAATMPRMMVPAHAAAPAALDRGTGAQATGEPLGASTSAYASRMSTTMVQQVQIGRAHV